MNYLPIPIRHYFHYAIIIERKKQYFFPQEVQFFYKICSCYSNFTVKNFSGVLHDLLSDIFARYALFYITFYITFFIQPFYITFLKETGKKFKQMLSHALRLNSCYLKIIHIVHQRYQPKIIYYILKNKQRNK